MKKYLLDLKVVSVEQLGERHVLIKLTDEKPLSLDGIRNMYLCHRLLW